MQAIKKALAASPEKDDEDARNMVQRKASHNILNDFSD